MTQDVLAGFFMVAERQYGFGDLVRLNVLGVLEPVTGTVGEMTLRITRIRTANGEVVTTPNGQIIQVINLSRDWARAVVDVPVPASADVAAVSALLAQVGVDAYADEELHDLLLDPPAVMGVESMDIDQFKNSRGRAHVTRQAVRGGPGTARPHHRGAAAGRNQRPDWP